jgi:hemerythrin-like metal-binding protein
MDAAYIVGVEEIDGQHREIFAVLDGLQKAIATEGQSHRTAQTLHILFDVLVTHFAYEESFMEKIDCADLEAHRQQHIELLAQFELIFSANKLGTIPERMEHILRDEISSHLLNSDMLMATIIERLVSRLRVHEVNDIHKSY